MPDDRWHCSGAGCTYRHPVATMVSDHEATCPFVTRDGASSCD